MMMMMMMMDVDEDEDDFDFFFCEKKRFVNSKRSFVKGLFFISMMID